MMQSEALWRPEKSIRLHPSDESEEGGRSSLVMASCSSKATAADVRAKKKSHGIARRRTPTLDLSAVVPTKEREKGPAKMSKPSREGPYRTIETRSEQNLLDFSLKSFGKLESNSCSSTDIRGWQEMEYLIASGKTSSSVQANERLQTPGEGQRNTLHSRAGSSRNSSRYGRRQDHYEFRHLKNAHEYIENYRKMYCFTTLSVPPSQQDKPITEEEVAQDEDYFMPVGVKSSYYQGDPYLKELAVRLGVRESIREQQLLQPPRKTPPSIVKKNTSHSDLFVSTTREEEDVDPSTPPSEEPFRKEPVILPLELPRIAQSTQIRSTNKSGSTISVTKYLQVTSPKQESENLEKCETVPQTVGVAIQSPSAMNQSEDIQLELSNNESREKVVKQLEDCVTEGVKFSPRATNSAQDQLYTLDSVQKEKRISQKAQALGLISRDWAKAPNAKKLFGNRTANANEGEYRYSRPATRAAPKESTGHKAATKEDEKMEAPSSKPATKQRQVDTQKLEKLKSIYEPLKKSTSTSHGGRSSSEKSHNAKCERKSMSRPITRLSNRAELHDLKYKRSQSYSRPITRLEKTEVRVTKARPRDIELKCLEESNYWNELPQATMQSQHKAKPKEASGHKNDEATIFAKVDATSKPARKLRKGHHAVALTMRTKRPPLLLHQSGITEPIPPGSGPKQIMEHLTRMKKKLDGVLGVQQHKITH